MRDVLLIGAGGFIGAILRYLVGLSTKIFKDELPLPLGTLIVNVVGCLMIGILATLAEEGNFITPQARNFLIVGILGAFTTFSTFGYESISLLRNESLLRFIANLVVQLVLGLGAVVLGMNLVQWFQK